MTSATPKPRSAFAPWLADTNDVTKVFLTAGKIPGLINLGGGLPDPKTWPVADLSALAARAVRDHASDTLAYPPVDGLAALRAEIAARYSTDRLTLTPDNVLITTAGTQALSLLGSIFLQSGDPVAAQSPAYLGALDAWRPRQPDYRPMALERNDCDLDAAMAGAQFAYTVPNFSNPSGRLVPLDQRRALVEAAERHGTWLIEDDPYGALYFDGAPLPRLLDLAAGDGPYDGPVIYLGTVSKELAPGLRIGWVIAAPEVIQALTIAKQGADMCSCGISQQMVLMAMQSGLMDRLMPEIVSLYRTRRDALCEAMEDHLSDLYDWQKPQGGMFVWAVARDASIDTDRLMAIGLEHGVCISPSSVFDPKGQDRRAIRINFTFNDAPHLTEGIIRLARATRATLSG